MLNELITESRNQRTMNLDELSIKDFLSIMNEEDQKVALAVKNELGNIEHAIKLVIASFRQNGRLIYIGAGTSGRLGLLDAVECPPTFGTDISQVVGLIAGGEKAFVKAVEGAEDSFELGEEDLRHIGLNDKDILIGISASGRTPYVMGALQYARSLHVPTVSISGNKNSKIGKYADVNIEIETGPEILSGSTRLKIGTAQKMVLNMISTGAMVGIGKVYGNLMIDLQTTNSKLVERAKNIIMQATGVTYEEAGHYLKISNNRSKLAVVMILTGLSVKEAEERLKLVDGKIRKAISRDKKLMLWRN